MDRSNAVWMVFIGGILLVLLGGHLYLIRGQNQLVGGLPLWLWLQVVLLFLVLGGLWITMTKLAESDSEALQ